LLHEESDDLPAHEAFVVEGGLPKYAVQEGILRSLAGGGAEQKTEKDFLKKRLQGEFPQGKFWEKAKESSKRLIQELLAKQDLEGCPFQELPPLDDDEFGYEFNPALAKENGEIVFVLPSKNGGSKQLWHEIAHLALNLTQKTDTRLLLKDATVERKGMPPQEAKARLHQLWELKETLDQKMIPIFPDAAWEYARHKKAGDLKAAIESAWKKLNEYPDPYTQAMTGEAGSFEELGEGIAEKFAALSNELFPHGGENS
jgi:exonuclease V gamma subunit